MGGRFCSLDQMHSAICMRKYLSGKLWNCVPEIKWKTKKSLHRKSGLFSAGLCGIYSFWLAFFRLIIQRSNLNGGTPKSRWGDANSRWGTRTPYNLSTDDNRAVLFLPGKNFCHIILRSKNFKQKFRHRVAEALKMEAIQKLPLPHPCGSSFELGQAYSSL